MLGASALGTLALMLGGTPSVGGAEVHPCTRSLQSPHQFQHLQPIPWVQRLSQPRAHSRVKSTNVVEACGNFHLFLFF